MKEMFRQFVYPETTSMSPPPNQVKCKGAPKGLSKRPRCYQEERSTKRSPSLVEHVEFQSQCSEAGQQSGRKTSQAPNWPNMNHLPLFMHQYFENVINVASDGHCGFRAVSGLIGDSVDSYNMVRLDLSIELKQNKKKDI
jgi:hypothetical protein